MTPVSRAYEKLKFALEKFNLNLTDKICADFGSSTGGFVQALTETKCKKIYSIETSKNRLHFVLKDDERVVIMDKTNAIHVKLPEKMDFISIDVGWTKQKLIIPNAVKNLKPNGKIISLIKPHYEIGKNLEGISDEELKKVIEQVKKEIKDYVKVIRIIESPIVGKKAKNKEFLMLCEKSH
jgi:23S rRNA (cytidine1920-2'-O)/16S rRNA (cytidine1409-2'-O)-methyltransferase